MSDIFREVEEDIRREQLKKLWNKYGILVIGVAALIIVATAGWRGWQWYSARQAAALGGEYYQAMQLARDGDPAAAETAFNDVAAKGGGFAAFARLRAAAARAEAGDLDGAVSEYDAVSSGAGVGTDLRDVARIRAGYVLLQQGDAAGVEQRVGELASEGNPWRNSARELLGLAAYQANDLDTALARFEEIMADNETPSDMRVRAQLMISLITADSPPSGGPDTSDGQDGTANQ